MNILQTIRELLGTTKKNRVQQLEQKYRDLSRHIADLDRTIGDIRYRMGRGTYNEDLIHRSQAFNEILGANSDKYLLNSEFRRTVREGNERFRNYTLRIPSIYRPESGPDPRPQLHGPVGPEGALLRTRPQERNPSLEEEFFERTENQES